MAVRSPSFSPVMIIQAGPIDQKRLMNKVCMVKKSQIPTDKPPPLLIRSSTQNKIFEDNSRGIICYKNENGEIICEGYDEGPRFHQKVSRNANYHQREAQIINFLHRSWFHIVEGDGFHVAGKGFAAIKGFDWKALKDTHY